MSVVNTDGSGPLGRLEVHLGWNIHPTGEWIDTDLIVAKLTGITQYSYTAIWKDHLPFYTLRFTNVKGHLYTFNDSNGNEHPADVDGPGDHDVEPFTALIGPHIKSVYVPFGNPNEDSPLGNKHPLSTKTVFESVSTMADLNDRSFRQPRGSASPY